MKLPPLPWRACEAPGCPCGLIWAGRFRTPIIRILHGNQQTGISYPIDQVGRLTRLVMKLGEVPMLLGECLAAGLPDPLARRVKRFLDDVDKG